MEEVKLEGGRTAVAKKGNTVYREPGYWSPSVMSFLKRLKQLGYPYSPEVIGSGFDSSGRETLEYIDGEVQFDIWPEKSYLLLGQMIRQLHDISPQLGLDDTSVWRNWHGRHTDHTEKVIGHCDLGPWNFIKRNEVPVGIIDWEVTGPVNPLYDLAYACWLNAQLYDDELSKKNNAPSIEKRCSFVRLMLDGYDLGKEERKGFVSTLIDVAINDTAREAIENNVTPEGVDPEPLWALAWRARSASWMTMNRKLLVELIEK